MREISLRKISKSGKKINHQKNLDRGNRTVFLCEKETEKIF